MRHPHLLLFTIAMLNTTVLPVIERVQPSRIVRNNQPSRPSALDTNQVRTLKLALQQIQLLQIAQDKNRLQPEGLGLFFAAMHELQQLKPYPTRDYQKHRESVEALLHNFERRKSVPSREELVLLEHYTGGQLIAALEDVAQQAAAAAGIQLNLAAKTPPAPAEIPTKQMPMQAPEAKLAPAPAPTPAAPVVEAPKEEQPIAQPEEKKLSFTEKVKLRLRNARAAKAAASQTTPPTPPAPTPPTPPAAPTPPSLPTAPVKTKPTNAPASGLLEQIQQGTKLKEVMPEEKVPQKTPEQRALEQALEARRKHLETPEEEEETEGWEE